MINKKEIEKALLKRSGGLRGIRCVDGCYFPQGIKTPHQRWEPQSPEYTLYMNQLIQTLDMFHKYSKKENILYTLHAGSLAGFYWNGKVMPWDDDVDIIVSMDSFKKIIKHFFEDEMPRSTCKAKQSYSRRQGPKKNFRVKKVDGVLYEVKRQRDALRECSEVMFRLIWSIRWWSLARNRIWAEKKLQLPLSSATCRPFPVFRNCLPPRGWLI